MEFNLRISTSHSERERENLETNKQNAMNYYDPNEFLIFGNASAE